MINGRIASIASLLFFLMAFRISHSFIHVKKLPNSFFPRHILSLRHLTYDHKTVEGKWQKYWVDHSTFKSTRRLGYPKKYILDMFPYPSGEGLHVGHPEGYTATDILSRYWRMKGYDVLHPMGWDAFGLPAEQYAINTGTHPSVTTAKNIDTFKRQLMSLGFSYDWSRELATTDEHYMKWTQWIFLQLFKNGLAQQSEKLVNWCPALGTVLANEEIINGLSERGSHPVVKLPLRQWLLKITEYADKLEAGLADIDWPEGTLSAQKQWIGKSNGVTLKFNIIGDNVPTGTKVEVFTTRIETLHGVTYLVLAPEHNLVPAITSKEQYNIVEEYKRLTINENDVDRVSSSKSKAITGVFLGTYAVHPLTGESLPIWIADYVLGSYGTGAVMAVPAHDTRDYEFAQNFKLPIRRVVSSSTEMNDTLPYTGPGIVCNSSPELNGLSSTQSAARLTSELVSKGLGKASVMYKLRDWVFSRQRYWGEPIPIYFPVDVIGEDHSHFDPHNTSTYTIRYDCPIAVPEEELPLKLPDMVDFSPGDNPEGCLARCVEWRFFKKDGKLYARETNTMPQWAGSCWYYLRFADPENTSSCISPTAANLWLPVDIYVGGQEHAVLHLLYARFWHKVLYDIGVVSHPEPFLKLVHQGMILGSDGEKMSKSRGNVVNPDDIVNDYGADVLRLYEMFMGPLEAVKPWQTEQLQGVLRFRDKVYNVVNNFIKKGGVDMTTATSLNDELTSQMHKTIKKVTEDIEKMRFNTAISALMVYTNHLMGMKECPPLEVVKTLVLLVSPFAPHVAEECWNQLGHRESISMQQWPQYDSSLCVENMVTISLQINGKTRSTLTVSADCSESDALALVDTLDKKIAKHTSGKTFKKAIYVPGKVLNLLYSDLDRLESN